MKKKYLYNKCNRCGGNKPENSRSTCSACIKENPSSKKKYIYEICQKCGVDKKNNTSSICNACAKIYRVNRSVDMEIVKKDIINFIKRIERRKGYASIMEIYVEMITLFYNTFPNDTYDNFEPKYQLEKMYIYLKDFVKWEEIKYNIYKKQNEYDEV